jgi:hypothetical protein
MTRANDEDPGVAGVKEWRHEPRNDEDPGVAGVMGARPLAAARLGVPPPACGGGGTTHSWGKWRR